MLDEWKKSIIAASSKAGESKVRYSEYSYRTFQSCILVIGGYLRAKTH